MSTVLLTGATGSIGKPLLGKLAAGHDVVTLSRGESGGSDGAVRGDFTSSSDLRALDAYEIDTAVHLAAVLYGAPEDECLRVNLLGTATLMRYLVERGCRRFVLASSIAASGCMSERFLPRELPIGDDHPCDAFDAYGMSKGLIEELALYYQRLVPALEIVLVRIGAVVADESEERQELLSPSSEMPFLAGGLVSLPSIVETLALAVERPLEPGVHRFNAVDSTLNTDLTVPELLRAALGERAGDLDLAHYEAAGHERDSLYAADRLGEIYSP